MARKREAEEELDKICKDLYQFKYLKLDNENKIHPLLIDHIIDKILGYILPTSDINEIQIPPIFQPLRLVCQIWNSVINSILTKTFASEELSFSDNNCDEISNFCQIWSKSLSPIPFSNFGFGFRFFVKKNSSYFLNFLTAPNILAAIKGLMLVIQMDFTMDLENLVCLLKSCNFEGLKVLRFQTIKANTNTIRKLNYNESNKELLCVSEPNVEISTKILWLLNLFRAFLNSAVNLELLSFYNPTQYQLPETGNLGAEFGKVLAELTPKKLKILYLVTEIAEQDLDILTEKRLKLETMYINFYGNPVSEAAVLNFLNSQTNTLKEFIIMDMEGYRRWQFWDFPIFPKLELLKFTGNLANIDLRFIKSFPNLKKLTFAYFEQGYHKSAETVKNAQVIHPSLESLEIQVYPIIPELIIKISCTFINLKKLQLNITKESLQTLETVLARIQSLQKLEILLPFQPDCIELDSALTGFPQDVCRQGLNACEEFLGIREPSLANFKELEKFSISSLSYHVITDVTVVHALLQLPKLKKVVNCGLFGRRIHISPKYLAILRKKCEFEFF